MEWYWKNGSDKNFIPIQFYAKIKKIEKSNEIIGFRFIFVEKIINSWVESDILSRIESEFNVYINKHKKLTRDNINNLFFHSRRREDTFNNLIGSFKSYANTIRSVIPGHFVKEILVYKPSKSSKSSLEDSRLFWENVKIKDASLEIVNFSSLSNYLKKKSQQRFPENFSQQGFSEQNFSKQRFLEQRSPKQRSPEQNFSKQRFLEQRSPEQRFPEQRSPNQRSSEQRSIEKRSPNQRSSAQRSPEQRSPEQLSPEQRYYR